MHKLKTSKNAECNSDTTRLTRILVAALVAFLSYRCLHLQKGSLSTASVGQSINADDSLRGAQPKWQPKSAAVACPGKMKTLDAKLYKAQFKEDKELMQWFGNLCNGSYIEMGALDGVQFSNTHVFHHGLGWKGLLLEASPRNYKKLVKNRPNELALVHAGVCAEAKDLHWVEGKFATTGGFLEFASKGHQTQYFTKKNIENAQVVRCQRLNDIFKEQMKEENLFFDFYSLDIEGAEYAALQTIDFDKVSFGAILVEASGKTLKEPLMKDRAVQTFLESKGYRYLENQGKGEWMEEDWFINKDWHNIYTDLIYT